MTTGKLTPQQFKLQLGVVGSNPHRAVQAQRLAPDFAIPNQRSVNEDAHLFARHLDAKHVFIAGAKGWQRRVVERLDVAVALVAALSAGGLPRICFYGDNQLRLRLDAPHRENQVARVLGTKFEPELDAGLTGTQFGFSSRGSKVGELRGDYLRRPSVYVRTHLGNVDREALAR